jgi:hypothetical protein
LGFSKHWDFLKDVPSVQRGTGDWEEVAADSTFELEYSTRIWQSFFPKAYIDAATELKR